MTGRTEVGRLGSQKIRRKRKKSPPYRTQKRTGGGKNGPFKTLCIVQIRRERRRVSSSSYTTLASARTEKRESF